MKQLKTPLTSILGVKLLIVQLELLMFWSQVIDENGISPENHEDMYIPLEKRNIIKEFIVNYQDKLHQKNNIDTDILILEANEFIEKIF